MVECAFFQFIKYLSYLNNQVVTEDTNGISVNYCSTHFGHGSNLGRFRLTADERAMIAGSDVNLCIVLNLFILKIVCKYTKINIIIYRTYRWRQCKRA